MKRGRFFFPTLYLIFALFITYSLRISSLHKIFYLFMFLLDINVTTVYYFTKIKYCLTALMIFVLAGNLYNLN